MSESNSKTAKDFMLSADSYPVIYQDETIKRALAKLQFSLSSKCAKRRNLLVLDRHDRPVGWVNLCDLLAVVQPTGIVTGYVKGWNISCFTDSALYYARQLANAAGLNHWDPLTALCEKVSCTKIKKIVRPLESGAVPANATLFTVATMMSKSNISTLPVVQKGKLVGFIRAEDIVIEMAQAVMNQSVKPKLPVYSTKVAN